MATVITMPQLGESVVEGTVARWLKRAGDRIEKYEPLVEIITEKVNVEVPSPAAGVIIRLSVEEGAVAPVGAEIAVIEEVSAANAAPTPAVSPASAGGNGARAHAAATLTAEREVPDVSTSNGAGAGVGVQGETPRRYTPVVLRMAETHQIDLERVPGTGAGGRVTKDDVLHFMERQDSASPVAALAIEQAFGAPAAPARSGETATLIAQRPAPQQLASLPIMAGPDEQIVPLTPMRRSIADNMTRSAATIPAAWCAVEADLTGLVALRQRIKGDVARRHSIDLTYVPFVALATVEALQEFPTVNAAWGGDCLVLRKRVHLGLAVSVADGLLVPVIRGADGMNLLGLARMCADLISRARQGRLTPDDMQGAAFTLNNTGALGSIISRPIVPPGQSGILNMEAIIKRPVVRDDAIAVRSMMNLCLSFDHRILDGREALGFLHAIRRRLEAWRADDAPL